MNAPGSSLFAFLDRTRFFEWRMCWPWGFLDGVGHLLHLPDRVQRPLCDRFDLALGMKPEEL